MANYVDLAPDIYRQRLVVEGFPSAKISEDQMVDYLAKLSDVLDMVALMTPTTNRSDKFGWAGWIHWETSGAHFYSWEQPRLFFSVDIYTCKKFDPQKAVDFTRDYFKATELTYKEF